MKNVGEGMIYSSQQHNWFEPDRIQQVISEFNDPGLLYIPSGTWEESIIVTQHNLTIVGDGEGSIIEGENGQSPITVVAPNVRIIDISVKTEFDVPAISFTHGASSQGVLQGVNVLESGSHGVYRDEKYASAVNAIVGCSFENIGGHAIYAEAGSGPLNFVQGNEGTAVDGDFIRWGVDSSLLFDNQCEDAPVRLTSDAKENLVKNPEGTKLIDDGKGNMKM